MNKIELTKIQKEKLQRMVEKLIKGKYQDGYIYFSNEEGNINHHNPFDRIHWFEYVINHLIPRIDTSYIDYIYLVEHEKRNIHIVDFCYLHYTHLYSSYEEYVKERDLFPRGTDNYCKIIFPHYMKNNDKKDIELRRDGYESKYISKIFNLQYEECVEIFGEFRDEKHISRFKGNEAHDSAMLKAKEIFNFLPETDY